MYYYKARIYLPTLGRFLQTDPIGYEDQINLYAFVGNDPVNNVDPDGEALETLWDAANVAIGVASAVDNFSQGNIGAGVVDTIGVVVDGAATVVPFVPGGAAAGLKVIRAADRAGDAAKGGKAAKAAGERARSNAKGVPNSRLGPSGKPKQHPVSHSSRKSAQQAAKKEADRAGGKVRNDANPANSKQGPHFQAEDAKGDNVKPVVHHERPDR